MVQKKFISKNFDFGFGQHSGVIDLNKDKYELQMDFTERSRNKNSEPIFEEFACQVDENKYFYPASRTKLPIVVWTLDTINKVRTSGMKMQHKNKN